MRQWLKSLLFSESKLFTLWGVTTYVDFTTKLFLLVVGLVSAFGISQAKSDSIGETIFFSLVGGFLVMAALAAVYGFVVMHEYGHAAVALRFGYPCRRITIYPIGGALELTQTPYDYPWAEFCISVAGPLVNVFFIPIFFGLDLLFPEWQIFGSFFKVNLALVLFNVLPMFPMDGGRMLRSFLGMWGMEPIKATRTAWYVAWGTAPLMVAYFTFFQFSPLIFVIVPILLMAGYSEVDSVARKVEQDNKRIFDIDKYVAEHGFSQEWHRDIRFFAECADMIYEVRPELLKFKTEKREAFVKAVVNQIAADPDLSSDLTSLSSLPPSLRSVKTKTIVKRAAEKATKVL